MWSVEKAVRELPQDIARAFMHDAGNALQELLEHRLKVVLIDAPDPRFPGHKVRAVDDCNPDWYRRLYRERPHFRRDRSIDALTRIRDGHDRPWTPHGRILFREHTHYDTLYRNVVLGHLLHGRMTDDGPVMPDGAVRAYWGLADDPYFATYSSLSHASRSSPSSGGSSR